MEETRTGGIPDEYLAPKEAGALFGYTADYVAKLCRDGVVNARRDGRGWFVEKKSLVDFVAKVALEEKKRLEKLSETRASEYRANREFIPLREVPARFGYTADYVARLCRDGAVNAIRIGREWSVELASLEQFAERTARSESNRLAQLRETRTNEYAAVAPVAPAEQKKKHNFLALFAWLSIFWKRVPLSSVLYPLAASFAVCLVAFLMTYGGVFSRIPFGKISSLFSGAPNVSTPIAVTPNTPAPQPATPTTVNNNYNTYNNTYHNTYNTYQNEVATGVSASDLNSALQGTKNSILSQVYGIVSNLDRGVSGNTQSIQLMNAPNSNLTAVNISNSTITGGTISGTGANLTSLSVSGATNLSSLSAATTTISGPLSVSSATTSTFASGIDLSSGCFSIHGNCIGQGGGGGGTWATTTSSVSSETVNYSTFSTDIVALGGSSTTSAKYWFDPNAGTSFLSGNVGLGTTSPSARLSLAGTAGGTANLLAVSTSTAGFATSTALTIDANGNLSLLNGAALTTSNLTLGTLNGPLSAQNGIVSATSSIGVLYGGTGTTTAPSYGQLLVGNANGGYDFIATSSLDFALGNGTGVVSVSHGGTGWGNVQAGGLLYGNGTSALATTSQGTGGQILSWANGVPSWVATTTFGTGLSYSGGNVTNTGVLSLAQTYGTAQSGALTLATSSAATNNGVTVGTNITNSSGTFTVTPTISVSNIPNGALANSTIGLSLGSSGTDANVSGSPASLGGTLTLNLPTASASARGLLASADWTTFNNKISSTSLSALFPLAYNSSSGAFSFLGLGTSSPAVTGNIPYFSGSNTFANVATTTITPSSAFTTTGTLGTLVGGTNSTIDLATNGTALSKLAQIAGNTILGNPTGVTGNVQAFATSTLGIALSDTTGTLAIARGGTATTTFYNGGVTFYNSALGTLSQASSQSGLFFDNTNGRLGIGNNSPATTLDVTGNARISNTLTLSHSSSCTGSEALQTDSSGNVSCGSISISGASTGGGWTTNNIGNVTLATTTDTVGIGATTTPYAKLSVVSSNTASTTLALLPASAQTANIIDIYNTSGNLSSVFTASGALGIGSTTPAATLGVSGNGLFNGNVNATSFTTSGNTNTNSLTIGSLNGILKATAGVVSTSLVNLASDVSGVLPVGNGGTGWGNIQSGGILYGNGTGNLATTSQGTGGQILSWQNGVPAWVATTTFSSPLNYSAGNVSLGYDSTLTTSGNNLTLNLANPNTWSGTQTFSTLPILSTLTGLISGNNGSLYSSATSTATLGLGLSGSLVGVGSSNSLTIATSSLFSGTTGQAAYFNGTNSLVGTSTLFIAPSGNVGVGTVSPSQAFSVNGNAYINANVGVGVAPSSGGTGRFYTNAQAWLNYNGTSNVGVTQIGSSGSSATIDLYDNNGNYKVDLAASGPSLFNAGNVGIGTTSPGTILSVGNTNGINFSTATSTFSSTGGINLSAGCFAIGGNCLSLSTLSGVLGIGSGGTGTTTAPVGQLLYGGATSYQSVATTTVTTSGALALSGNPVVIGSSPYTLSLNNDSTLQVSGGNLGINLGNPNSWNALQQFANASSTLFSSTYASSTNAFLGNLSVGTLSGLLYGNGGAVSSASVSSPLSFSGGTLSLTTVPLTLGGTGTSTGGVTNGVEYYNGSTLTNNSGFIYNGTNVGIGTTSPYANLSVQNNYGSNNTTLFSIASSTASGGNTANTFVSVSNAGVSSFYNNIQLKNTATAILPNGNFQNTIGSSGLSFSAVYAGSFGDNTGNPISLFTSGSSISLNVGGSNVMRLLSSAVGIGTTSPSARLDVAGVNNGTAPLFQLSSVASYATTTQFIVTNGGSVGIGTTSPGSILSIGNTGANTINISNTATSTFGYGINLNAGCFAIGGNCLGLGNGTLSGTLPVANGGTGQSSFTPGNLIYGAGTSGLQSVATSSLTAGTGVTFTGTPGALVGGTALTINTPWTVSGSNIYNNNAGNVGIGTTSPYAAFSVAGSTGVVAQQYLATSTTATSTFAGGLSVGNGALNYDYSTGVTSIQNLNLGSISFDADAGQVSWVDMPVTSASALGTIESYTAQMDGNPLLTIFGVADGAGNTATTSVGIASTTPFARFSVDTSSLGYGQPSFAVGSSTRSDLLLTQGGLFGIGTTTPGATLAVQGGAGQVVDFAGSTGASYFHIASGGNVGLGTTTPGTLLSLGNTGTNTVNLSNIATSTFGYGINLNAGCFSINGTCLSLSALSGVLGIGSGGTGTTTAPAGQLIYGGATAYQSVATSSVSAGTGVTFTGTPGALVGGTALTINNSGVLSLQQLGGGTTQTGALTIATSSDTNLLLNVTNTGGAFTFTPAWSGSLGIGRGGTGITSFTPSQLLYGNGTAPLSSVATSSLTAGTGLTVSAGSLGYQIGGTNATIGLAPIAANSVLANPSGSSGVPTAVATSSIIAGTGVTFTGTPGYLVGGTNLTISANGVTSIAVPGDTATGALTFATTTSTANGVTSSLAITGAGTTLTFTPSSSGTLTVAGGGTGWNTLQANTLLTGNGTSAIATTSVGTGLSLAGGTLSNAGVLSLQQTYGTTQTGTLTIATSSDTNLLLNVTNTGGAFTFTPAWSGTLAAARLNANVVQSVTNDTNITGSISAQNLTLGWTGTLAAGRGGTGQSAVATGDLLYGSGTNAWSRLGIGVGGQVLAVVSGIPQWVASTTLSTITGILPVTSGGTGWGNIQANTLLTGNGTSAIATTSVGTGLSLAGGTLSNAGVLSLQQTYGTTQTGALTIATSSDTNLLLNVTNTGGAFTFTPAWSGSLGIGRGGTGITSFTPSQLLYGNGTAPLSSVATSSLTAGTGLTVSAGSLGYQIGGTNATIGLAPIAANSVLANPSGSSGVPTAVATSSIIAGTGVTFTGTPGYLVGGTNLTISANGVTSIAVPGDTATGALTFATTTSTANGVTSSLAITGAGTTLTFTPSSSGTLTVAGGGTGITSVSSNALLYGSGSTALNTLSSTANDILTTNASGVPQWVATSTLNINLLNTTGTLQTAEFPALTGDVTTPGGSLVTTIAANAVTYAKFQQVAANSLIGNATGATGNATAIATTSLGIDFPHILGTAGATQGGTGQSAVATGDLLYGSGTNAWSRLGVGTGGYILAVSNGIPGWVSTSTINNGVTSLAQTYGTAQTGALTIATSSDTNLLLNVTNTGGTFTFAPTWSGTLAAGRLNSNVVQSVTNDTNITGSISAQNLTLGWTGTLAAGRGGTGISSPSSAGVLLGTYAGGGWQQLATSSLGLVTSVAASGGTTGLSFTGSPVTTSGTLTLGGTLGIANGGTNNTGAYTLGSVIYSNGTSLTQDNANFFWDGTNHLLGLGTSTPARRLDVADNGTLRDQLLLEDTSAPANNHYFGLQSIGGSFNIDTLNDALATTTRFTINSSGNVGLGTTSPTATLGLQGSIGVNNSQLYLTSGGLVDIGTTTMNNALFNVGGAIMVPNATGGYRALDNAGNGVTLLSISSANNVSYVGSTVSGSMQFSVPNSSGGFQFLTGSGNTNVLQITNAGNVGIGTTSPGTLLSLGNTGTNTVNLSNVATSTFGYGLNILNGCFAVNGTCLSPSPIGTALAKGNFIVGSDAGTAQATSTIFISSTGQVGIGTTTPFSVLSVSTPAQQSGTLPLFTVASTTNASLLTVLGNGNVGVGMTNPLATLDISGSSGWGQLRVMNPGGYWGGMGVVNSASQILTGDTTNQFDLYAEGGMNFSGNGSAIQMVLNTSGNVGIGTTTPATALDVAGKGQIWIESGSGGAVSSGGAGFKLEDSGGQANLLSYNYSTSAFGPMTLNGSVLTLNASSGGNVGIGTASPGAKLEINDETNGGILALTRDAGYLRGTLEFARHNSGTPQIAAQIASLSDLGSNNNGILYFYTANSSGALNPNMTILGNGNVGIGTTSPGTNLDISPSTGNASLRVKGNASGAQATLYLDRGTSVGSNSSQTLFLTNGTPDWSMGTAQGSAGASDYSIYDYGTSANVLTILKSSGNVGIGTTTPNRTLQVQGSVSAGPSATGAGVAMYGSGSYGQIVGINNANTTYNALQLLTGASPQGITIDTSGNVGVGTASPGANLEVDGSTGLRVTYNNTQTGDIEALAGSTGGLLVLRDGSANTKIVLDDRGTNNSYINNGGNFGIGDASPADRLSVAVPTGTVEIAHFAKTQTTNDTGAYFALWGGASGNTPRGYLGFAHTGTGGDTTFTGELADALDLRAENSLQIGAGGNHIAMTVLGSNQNVGIGTTSPSQILSVAGNGYISGNLGIGTNSYTYPLEVRSTNGNGIRFTDSTNGVQNFLGAYNSVGITGTLNNFPLALWTNNAERVRIDTSGNVGIGTTNPAAKLHVETTGTGNQVLLNLAVPNTIGNNSAINFSVDNAGTNIPVAAIGTDYSASASIGLTFSTYSSSLQQRMEISPTGSVGIGTTSPDAQLNITSGTTDALRLVTANSSPFALLLNNLTYGYGDSKGVGLWQDNIGNLKIAVSNTVVLTAQPNGNVGIGNTSPGNKLDVNGNIGIAFGNTLFFNEYYGSNYEYSTTNYGAGISQDGSGNLNLFTAPSGTANTVPSNTTRLTILNGGNVGIGLAGPKTLLNVNGGSGAYPTLGTNVANSLFVSRSDGVVGTYFGYASDGNGWIQQMRNDVAIAYNLILQPVGGNVGIGTTGPNAPLEIHNAGSGASQLRLSSASGGNLGIDFVASASTYSWQLGAQNEVGNAFTITPSTASGGTTFTTPAVTVLSSGNVGIGTTGPTDGVNGALGTILDVNSATSANTSLVLQSGATSGSNAGGIFSAQTNLSVTGSKLIGELAFIRQADVTSGYISSNAQLYVNNNGTLVNAMSVAPSGNVGIGTTNPGQTLTVTGYQDVNPGYVATFNSNQGSGSNAGNQLNITNAAGGWGLLAGFDGSGVSTSAYHGANAAYLINVQNAPLNFGTNNAEQMTILGNGNVGIGTTGPNYKLEVAGTVSLQGPTSNTVSMSSAANIAANYLLNGNGGYWGLRQGAANDINIDVWNSASPKTALTILQSGNVGIGNTSPGQILTIGSGTVSNNITLGAGYANFGTDYSGWGTIVGADVQAKSGANSGMQISNSYVAGGASALDMQGGTMTFHAATGSQLSGYTNGSSFSFPVMTVTGNTSGNIFAVATSTGTTYFAVSAQNGNATFTGSGGTCTINGSGSCTSDARLKTNIQDISGSDALAGLAKISGVTYNWKDPSLDQSQRVGVIAQDVLLAFPQLVGTVTTTLDGVPGTYYTVNYAGLTAPLISAVDTLNSVYDASQASTSQPSILSLYQGTTSPAIIIDENGNLGIGTTTSSTSPYKVSVGGDVMATGFVNLSEQSAKTDISYVDASTTAGFLDTLRGMMVAEYRYKNEATTSADRLGFIAEQAPQVVRSSNGQGIDLYKLITFAIGSIQALADKMDQMAAAIGDLETRVAALEAAASSAAGGAVSGVAGNVASTVQSFLTSQGVTIANGTVTAGTVAATQFNTVADANGESAAGSGTVAAGTTTVVVHNTYVNQGSHVFVTFNSDPGAGGWYVSKSDGSFTLNLDAAPQSNASFDYFIVGSPAQGTASSSPSSVAASSTSPSNFGTYEVQNSGDTQAPLIQITGANPATVSVGSSYADLGAIITDNVSKNIGYSVSVDGGATTTTDTVNIDTSVPGTHTIAYSATDQAGNTAIATRIVNVVAVSSNGTTASSSPATVTSAPATTTASSTPAATPALVATSTSLAATSTTP